LDRKTAVTYCLLVAMATISALVAVVWFGSNGGLESVTGVGGRPRSVWRLFAIPAVLTAIGLGSAFAWSRARADDMGPDARLALEQYRNTERRFVIGAGLVIVFIQLLVILRTAGVAIPYELGYRASFVVFGALWAAVGNMIPKIPFFGLWWPLDRATYTKVSRFSGWAVTISGVVVCLLALFAPLRSVTLSVGLVGASVTGAVIINGLFETLVARKKPG